MKLDEQEKELKNLKNKWQCTKHRAECTRGWLVQLQVLSLPLLPLCLTGCSAIAKVFAPQPTIGEQVSFVAGEVGSASSGLGMLNYVGAISTVIGICALVITRGAMGMRAIFIGIGLCLLNFVVATYAHWIIIPMLVASGLISLAWGYVTIKEVLDNKE